MDSFHVRKTYAELEVTGMTLFPLVLKLFAEGSQVSKGMDMQRV